MEVPFQNEAQYVVPIAEKDDVPHASEGMRTPLKVDVSKKCDIL